MTQLNSIKINDENKSVETITTIVKPTQSEHILHLYSPKVDKYSIQKPVLFFGDSNEEAIYVTRSSVNSLPFGFISKQGNPEIIDPEQFFKIKDGTKRLRIVIDASSICEGTRFDANSFTFILDLEEFINKLVEKRPIKCLCTYDVTLLDPSMNKQLVKYHNRLLLTTSDVTVLSGSSIDKSEFPSDSFKEIVKNNLETIVLALIQKKPMCGMDIMEIIHKEFNVFLSPGTVYPLLHLLNSRGLLRFEATGKTKRYISADQKAEEEIQNILKEQIQVSKFLSGYLTRTMISNQEKRKFQD